MGRHSCSTDSNSQLVDGWLAMACFCRPQQQTHSLTFYTSALSVSAENQPNATEADSEREREGGCGEAVCSVAVSM